MADPIPDFTPRYWFELPVRYADTDAQGHVYFANYLTFMDEAVTGYLHAIGCPPASLVEQGVDVVYVDAQSNYHGSSYFEDRLRIGVTIARFGRTSFTALCKVQKGDEVITRGRLTSVCIDPKRRVKVPVPDRLRDAVARYES